MKKNSIFKILILINCLLNKKRTRQEILLEYKKFNINISNALLSIYIKKLKTSGFEIQTDKIGQKKLYKLNKENINLQFSNEDLKILYEIKQLIFAQKDYRYIKELMELLIKISKYITNKEIKEEFLDFGYFSTLNWKLIEIIEKHCKTKDILLLDYLLPNSGNKLIQFQVDKIELSKMSQRIYLIGVLENGVDYYRLPIDRIYKVKKVIKKNTKISLPHTIIRYKISKNCFDYIETEEWENIISQDNKTLTIEAKVQDKFAIIQRLLYFCPDLFYISESEIRKEVIKKLNDMKEMYATNS